MKVFNFSRASLCLSPFFGNYFMGPLAELNVTPFNTLRVSQLEKVLSVKAATKPQQPRETLLWIF
jgi:hypothetical protein